ncbi:uncharacterized protein [Nerophis lumbriciformis]|uniref:uncharacterized protein n=1 Tax=Nerophis lumbriciformis TaxID=546530 RepID=UPI002ADF9307|nr:peroxisome proliferator-activated receptor gamma coactivator-related protein 1-like isoform X1 [Nerophis lumbriciformis]
MLRVPNCSQVSLLFSRAAGDHVSRPARSTMWSGKMASQWRYIDEALNAGNVDFASSVNPSQIGPYGGDIGGEDMDQQSCLDHAILAIFEDSTVLSEDTENETLLSALTQMLDCVEDDVGSALSPFDTLPDTKLLTYQPCGFRTKDEAPFTDKLRTRSKSPSLNRITKSGAGKEEKKEVVRLLPVSRQQSQTLFPAQIKKADNDVEVFTSSSLVNLVKLMHPYCLELHVEEEEVGKEPHNAAGPSTSSRDNMERKHTIFSQEEVWKYEKPTGDSDEDINVVSDDETPLGGTKKDVNQDSQALLKSTLLNGNSSRHLYPRAKKNVSFGPVQVVSFDQSVESPFNLNNLPSVTTADILNDFEAVQSPADPQPAELTTEVPNKAEEPLLKREMKAKSLSLQEYRQLRQKKQPLVEKQGNNTTKWPSLSELPKELTPILCSHGQRQNLCGIKSKLHHPDLPRLRTSQPQKTHKTCHTPHPVKKMTQFSVRCCGFNPLQTENLSPQSPLPDKLTEIPGNGPVSKNSLVNNRTLYTTDPPNPVLLPLSVTHTPASSSHHSPLSNVEFTVPTIPTFPVDSKLIETTTPCPIMLQNKSSSECRNPPSITVPKICQLTSPDASTCKTMPSHHSQPVKNKLPEVPATCSAPEVPLPSQQLANTETSTAAESGIEAPDLTSLLEQFEEKQAKEDEPLPELKHTDNTGNTVEDKSVKDVHLRIPKSATTVPVLERKLENVKIPEPLGTEVVLSTQDTSGKVRWRTSPSKAIKIIDPRPLPCRRTNNSEISASPHTCSSVTSDHDYCMPTPTPTPLRNIPKTTYDVKETISSVDYKEASIKTFDTAIKAAGEKQQSSSSTHADPLYGGAPSCTPLTPPPSPPSRGREKRKYRKRSPLLHSSRSSSSSSSSASCSPKRQRFDHTRSGRRSWSSSPSPSVSRSPPRPHKLSSARLRCSRSRSRSWSRSRSRSPSPFSRTCLNSRRDVYRVSHKLKMEKEARIQKLKAIDERRVVYIGRIRRSMTHDELRERFSQFGEVECVSLHFRNKGDHYGFVTFYNMEDAFTAIDNGGKLRRPDELPFDICFGGRRQFCNSNYADLDASEDTELSPVNRFQELDFDSLLKQAQRGLR